MKIWGIAFILLGGGGILAAVFNWNAWFRISSAGGHVTHDAFGRTFARLLNIAVGIPLLVLGIADVTGQLPVSEFMNIWLFENTGDILAASEQQSRPPPTAESGTSSGLSPYAP